MKNGKIKTQQAIYDFNNWYDPITTSHCLHCNTHFKRHDPQCIQLRGAELLKHNHVMFEYEQILNEYLSRKPTQLWKEWGDNNFYCRYCLQLEGSCTSDCPYGKYKDFI